MNFVEELRWRGMLHDIMPGTEDILKKECITAYVGIDPTADSLHIGHLCSVMMLKHFQRCGHKPIVLVGGATGMIGDPSGKSDERNLLDEDTLRHNQEAIRLQLQKFLDFGDDAPNAAELVNNYDWMKDVTFLDFARNIGKHITVNYMMSKDSVKRRLNGEFSAGMSFTEFTYQLLQGFDFLHLYRTRNCKLQMGGSTYSSYRAERGFCPHLSAYNQSRRHQVRQNRDGQYLVVGRVHLAIQILPILAKYRRRRCRTIHQNFYRAIARRDSRPCGRAQECTARTQVAETLG